MRCGSKTMPPTTWTPCVALMLVMRAGAVLSAVEVGVGCAGEVLVANAAGEGIGASKGARAFSLPSQRKRIGL